MARILITGAAGMLGSELARRLPDAVATDVAELDITGEIDLPAIDWIVNCAAYTAVDRAETDAVRAFAINATGPTNLARAARRRGARLLHLSSDYVFSGGSTPYREDHPPAPVGVYGRSKHEGDVAVMRELPDAHLIVRTSWLHGVGGPNFVDAILRQADAGGPLRVVADQIGSPTWARWLAGVLVRLIDLDARGVYHASSRGNISWFEFAREIVRLAGLDVEVHPQTTAELGRPAPRPAYSTLDVSKLEAILGEPCPSWQDGLREHLQERNRVR